MEKTMNEQLRKAIEEAKIPPYNDPHESWCDTENSISTRCNCIASGYLDALEDAKASQAKLLRVIEVLVQQRNIWVEHIDLLMNSHRRNDRTNQDDAELIAALEGK